MKVGIMQPYLFPYIGYWQVVNAVDKFVIYDDVNYIKQGWINRNRILLEGRAHTFTLELKGVSSFKKINEIEIGGNKLKIVKTISQAYRKAPFYNSTMNLVFDIFQSNETNLAKFITESIIKIANYLKINANLVVSSQIEKNNSLKGEEKIVHICKLLDATEYINTDAGLHLYNPDRFKKESIFLQFLKCSHIEYNQANSNFVANLSIIDMMMFNSRQQNIDFLNQYILI